MANLWPRTVAAVGEAPHVKRELRRECRATARLLWHEAVKVWREAAQLRDLLQDPKDYGTSSVAGLITVPCDAAMVLVQTPPPPSSDEAASAAAAAAAAPPPTRFSLFAAAAATTPAAAAAAAASTAAMPTLAPAVLPPVAPGTVYACTWHLPDSGLLDDIAAVWNPRGGALESLLWQVVRADGTPLPTCGGGTHLGFVAVVFGAVASVSVRGQAPALEWDAAGAGDDAGTAGDTGRVMAEELAAVRLRKAAWVAWHTETLEDASLDVVIITPANPHEPPLVAVYALYGIKPMSTDTDDVVAGTQVTAAFADAVRCVSSSEVRFGYHLRYPTAPVEAKAVGSVPPMQQLRGVDLAAATAALAAGYTVGVEYCWMSAVGCSEPELTLSDTAPVPLAKTGDVRARGLRYKLRFPDYFTVPGRTEYGAHDVVWLNHPQHLDVGVVHDTQEDHDNNEAMDCSDPRIVGLVGTVLTMTPPADDTTDYVAPIGVAALQGAVEDALTSARVVHRLAIVPPAPKEYHSHKVSDVVPAEVAAVVGRLATSLAAPMRSLWYAAGSISMADCDVDVTLAFPGGALRFPPPPGTPDLAAYLTPLMAACAPAAFGRGTETVLDPTVRRAWALPAAALATDWHPGTAGVLECVQRALGASMPPLRATLGKANVYGPGDFFHAHADTLRCDTMVGTLVVCLPCAHTGGDLVLRHDGVTERTAWGTEAGSGKVQWAAFYSDVLHEVEPVTSGYRVTLTYDLYADTSRHVAGGERVEYGTDGQLAVVPRALPATAVAACPLAAAAVAAATNPARWSRGGYMGIFASHAYPITSAGSVDAKLLKGADALVWRALHDAGCHPRVHPVLLNLPKGTGNCWNGGMNAIFVGAQAARDGGYKDDDDAAGSSEDDRYGYDRDDHDGVDNRGHRGGNNGGAGQPFPEPSADVYEVVDGARRNAHDSSFDLLCPLTSRLVRRTRGRGSDADDGDTRHPTAAARPGVPQCDAPLRWDVDPTEHSRYQSAYVLRDFTRFQALICNRGLAPWDEGPMKSAGNTPLELGIVWLISLPPCLWAAHSTMYVERGWGRGSGGAGFVVYCTARTHHTRVQQYGNEPANTKVFYTSVAILVKCQAPWTRRRHAVALFAARAHAAASAAAAAAS